MIHWTKLKQAVESAGGTWTNREDAEVFLAGRMPEEDVPVFDKSRPYFEVSGRTDGAYYKQGDTYFNQQGKKVG